MFKRTLILTLALVVAAGLALGVHAAPKTETLSGTVADLTCATKGKALMDTWHNATHDAHKTGEGEAAGCATACLKGGQPAALFADGEVVTVFACNPRATLADFAAQEVEVQGTRVGASFLPAKIRAKGAGAWQDVNCATMH